MSAISFLEEMFIGRILLNS